MHRRWNQESGFSLIHDEKDDCVVSEEEINGENDDDNEDIITFTDKTKQEYTNLLISCFNNLKIYEHIRSI